MMIFMTDLKTCSWIMMMFMTDLTTCSWHDGVHDWPDNMFMNHDDVHDWPDNTFMMVFMTDLTTRSWWCARSPRTQRASLSRWPGARDNTGTPPPASASAWRQALISPQSLQGGKKTILKWNFGRLLSRDANTCLKGKTLAQGISHLRSNKF